MSEKNAFFNPAGMLTAPFVIGTAALEMTLMTTVSLARVVQIAIQSADTAQEIKKGRRHESVKVE